MTTCPNCGKTYTPVLGVEMEKARLSGDNRVIQQIFPHAPAWQREQLISGICSDKCWDEYLGVDFSPEGTGEGIDDGIPDWLSENRTTAGEHIDHYEGGCHIADNCRKCPEYSFCPTANRYGQFKEENINTVLRRAKNRGRM